MRAVPGVVPALLLALVGACSGAAENSSSPAQPSDDDQGAAAAGTTTAAALTTVSTERAKRLLDNPPQGLVVLDVRTDAEFAEGHLAGAVQLDFYAADFEAQISALDREPPYLLYCRSGNRSGKTLEIMKRLGFVEVYELEGGISAWSAASLPVTTATSDT
ncbi:MAG: rhodanese-like domain-containing protein [Myxococcales bacterium]|nr:rhodanese-like domain-containing protein [Myxococcales bacterium]